MQNRTHFRLDRMVALGVLCLATCNPGVALPDTWALSDGQPLSSVVAEKSSGVVLVIDPSQVFACTSLLAQWLDWEEANPGRFRIVLSRPPLDWERPRLAPIPTAGSLSAAPDAGRLPVELAFADGKIVYESNRLLGISTSSLLEALRGSTLDQALAVLK